MATKTLDCQGLSCPLPILRTTKVMRGLAAGETLEVLATDSNAPMDFQSYSEVSGNELLENRAQDGIYRFLLRKGG